MVTLSLAAGAIAERRCDTDSLHDTTDRVSLNPLSFDRVERSDHNATTRWRCGGHVVMSEQVPADGSQETLGSFVRRWRAERGFTIEELAERSGLSAPAVGQIERDQRRQPHATSIKKLVKGLQLTGEERARLHALARPLRAQPIVHAIESRTAAPLPARPEVLISYARGTGRALAQELHELLAAAGIGAALGATPPLPGAELTDGDIDAVLSAHVLVACVDTTYLTYRHCREELGVALAVHRLLRQGGAPRDVLAEALRAVVILLPDGAAGDDAAELLDPDLRDGSCTVRGPHDRDRLVAMVRSMREAANGTIGGRLDQFDARPVSSEAIREAFSIPAPGRIGRLRIHPADGLKPSIGDEFAGRARELWELHSALMNPPAGQSAASVVLEGPGGFGKTRLAIEYVHRFAPSWFSGGVIWLDASSGDDRLEVEQHELLTQLRPETPDLRSFRAAGRSVATELGDLLQSEARARPMLVVLDDFPEQDGPVVVVGLQRWCRALGSVSLLVSSRARSTGPGLRRIAVPELTSEAAASLLRRGLGGYSELSEDDWTVIADWVGHLPLALELLNACLQGQAVSPSELLHAARNARPVETIDRYARALSAADSPRRRAFASVRRRTDGGRSSALAFAFDVSFRRLPPQGRRAARLVACLATAPIPQRLVAEDGGQLLTSTERALLSRRSFVLEAEAIPGSVDTYGRMHSLVADHLRSTRPGFSAELRAVCHSLLLVMTERGCRDPASWPVMNACRPHAEAVFDRMVDRRDAGESVAHLGLLIGLLVREQGNPSEALDWARRAESITLRLGRDHPEALRATESVAAALHDLGDLARALPLQERVLEARRRTLGADHAETQRAVGNMAAMLFRVERLTEAQELAEQMLATAMRRSGPKDPDTLWAMGSLASISHALGDIARARQLEERVLRMRKLTLGPDHPDTLISMESLAAVLVDQGELGPARALQEQVLERRSRSLGPEHPDTRRALSSLREMLLGTGVDVLAE
jgi:transcriptional regulator with XRE-family HTH domain